MDGDLFQYVLLGLLAVGVIVLVALLATLGGIRKALEDRARSAAATSEPETAPSPSSETETPAQDTAVTTAGASEEVGRAATIRGVLEQHGLQDSAQAAPVQDQPAQAQPVQAQPAALEPVVDSVFAAHADDPQEEPFQRDGRWWFKRGDELLLYDEATGQWEPAPAEGAAASAPVAAASEEGQAQPVSATTATTTADVPAVADQVSTFWKCPTCGAVNGSTAATCRMCFAARP